MVKETGTAGEQVAGQETRTTGSAPDWFDVQDLARRYKTSSRHIFRLADQGRMPWGVKLGQLRRWSRFSIEQWEAGGCQPVRSTTKSPQKPA